MVSKEIIQDCLRIWIPTGSYSDSDLDNLTKNANLANQAMHRFLANKLSESDFLGILETCGIDVDNYLSIVDKNAEIIRLETL